MRFDTAEQAEAALAALEAERDAIGKRAHERATELYAASRQAMIDAVGDKARCMCWWEGACDAADTQPKEEQPLWYRLEAEAVLFDNIACELGHGNVPSDGFACKVGCDCPYYDEQGQPRETA